MKHFRFLILLAVASNVCVLASMPASRAAAAFEKLQSLAGNWEGKDEGGQTVKSSFKIMVANTMVMETLKMPGMEEMVTLYSIDGDAIALIHYCPTNNQPRMRALPSTGEVKKLVFSFEGAGNLPTPETGHEHKLVIDFEDKDHITERWTWRKNGKETESVYHFVRKAGN